MDRWLKKFLSKLDVNDVERLLIAKYIDYMNIFLYALERGMKWKKKK